MLSGYLGPLAGYPSPAMHLVNTSLVIVALVMIIPYFLMQSILHFKWNEKGMAGEGEEGSWIDSAPDDIKAAIPQVEIEKADPATGKTAVMGPDPNVTKYKTAAEFFKGHNELTKLIAAKGVIVPGEKATPEEISAFRKGIGVPDKIDGYKFTEIKNLHKSFKVTPESQAVFANMALKHGLTPIQADGVNQDLAAMMSAVAEAQDKAHNDKVQGTIAQLQKEWGDQMPVKIGKMKQIVEKIGGPEAIADLGDFSNNPFFLKIMDGMISKLSEDTIKSFGINAPMGSGSGDDVSNAQKFIAECNAIISANDPKHPLNNENDPKHQEWVDKRDKAYKTAYPSGGGQ